MLVALIGIPSLKLTSPYAIPGWWTQSGSRRRGMRRGVQREGGADALGPWGVMCALAVFARSTRRASKDCTQGNMDV
eukprot:923579-Prorocentrum_minimum.AAC.4